MVLGFYRFCGLTIFPIDYGRLVVVLPIGLLGLGSRLLLGVLLGPIVLCAGILGLVVVRVRMFRFMCTRQRCTRVFGHWSLMALNAPAGPSVTTIKGSGKRFNSCL